MIIETVNLKHWHLNLLMQLIYPLPLWALRHIGYHFERYRAGFYGGPHVR